jgi:aspartyl-tRNA(Asn)/glutamyl-tRNA(Gln) amidotransferase subunit B
VNIEIPLRRREDTTIEPANTERHAFYASVFNLVQEQKLSSTNAKALIAQVLESGQYPAQVAIFAEQQGYIQVSDMAAITAIVVQVIDNNPKAVEDVRNGEAKAIGFLVGQVMKQSQGKANPKMAQDLIRRELGIE